MSVGTKDIEIWYIWGQNIAKSKQGTLNRGPSIILILESESKALKTINPLL